MVPPQYTLNIHLPFNPENAPTYRIEAWDWDQEKEDDFLGEAKKHTLTLLKLSDFTIQ